MQSVFNGKMDNPLQARTSHIEHKNRAHQHLPTQKQISTMQHQVTKT